MKKTLFVLLITSSPLFAQKNIFDVCRSGSTEDLSAIYKSNPDIIDQVNEAGYSPLILACYHNNVSAVSFLIDKVKDINGSCDLGTPLMAAVVKGNFNITKLLLEKNADPNISDLNNTTALHYATLFKLPKIAKLLVKSGAKYNLKDNNGKTAYDYAFINDNQELLTLFKN